MFQLPHPILKKLARPLVYLERQPRAIEWCRSRSSASANRDN
jgi:ribosomal protein L24E